MQGPCPWNTSTYTLTSSNWRVHRQQHKVSDARPPIFSSFFFFFFFFFSFETRPLRGDRSFRPEPVRIPPLEDIHFLDDIQIKIQNMRFQSLTNDQTVSRYRYFHFYEPHNQSGWKKIFLADAYFENCSVGSEIKSPHRRV